MEFIYKYRKYILAINRIILGAVFVFSGLVKSIDPMGTAIKIGDYLNAFGLDNLTILSPYTSVLLCGTELFIGLMLVMGLQKRFTSIATFLITFAFTILTIYIAIESPVSDCGCFGDALILSNTDTLIKNILLLLMSVSLITEYFYKYTRTNIIDTIYVCWVLAISFALPTYTITRVTPVDFLPYGIDTNIEESMHVPDNAKQDEYEITLIYENLENGEIKEFSETDTTWYDSQKWKYIDTKTKLISKGEKAKISSFDIIDSNSNSMKDSLFNTPNLILFVVDNSASIEEISQNDIDKLYAFKEISNSDIWVITPADTKQINLKIKYLFDKDIKTYAADAIQLKSMLRSKVGIIYLQDATILAKSTFSELPMISSEDEYHNYIDSQHSREFNFILILIMTGFATLLSYCLIKFLKK